MAKSEVTLRYNAPEHYTYERGDLKVNGGGTLTVSASVAEDLLTEPGANFTEEGSDGIRLPSRAEILGRLDRNQLVEAAETVGVFNPGLIADDDDLIKAIIDAEAPSEDRIKRLVDDNTREQLDTLADQAGIEDPGSLDNKEAVAQAIVNHETGAADVAGEGQTDTEVA